MAADDKSFDQLRNSFASAGISFKRPEEPSSSPNKMGILTSGTNLASSRHAPASMQSSPKGKTAQGHAADEPDVKLTGEGQWKDSGSRPINYALANARTYEEREAAGVPLYGFMREDDEEEGLAERNEALELHLFGAENISNRGTRQGVNYEGVLSVKVILEGEERIQPVYKFDDPAAGLHPAMLENIRLSGFSDPTPIQRYTLPAVAAGKDVIACAQTGSGKTAAYLIPVISNLMGRIDQIAQPRFRGRVKRGEEWTEEMKCTAHPLVLILVPTRELAVQVFHESRRFCYRSKMRPCVVYGGGPMRSMIEDLRKGCELLIATPGRLIDVCRRPNVLSLSKVIYTIFDEADELLKDDWAEELKKIMTGTDRNNSQDEINMMFSATFPRSVAKLALDFMANDHLRIKVGRIGSVAAGVTQRVISVARSESERALLDLFDTQLQVARTIVFVNHKGTVDLIDDLLHNHGVPVTGINADRTQAEREDSIRAFRLGKVGVLVSTEVAARGLDFHDCLQIVNYNMPKSIAEYVHRIGRTARIGNDGFAYSFFDEDRDQPIAEDLVKILIESKQHIPDFLESYKPADGVVDWGKDEFDPSDEDGEDEAAGQAAGAQTEDHKDNAENASEGGKQPEGEGEEGW